MCVLSFNKCLINILSSFKTHLIFNGFLRGLVNKRYFLTNALTHRFKKKIAVAESRLTIS